MNSSIKCVVWDLDETLWQGTLAEQAAVSLTSGAGEVVRELDRRGILQSIASRNDFDVAWRQVAAFGLDEYFLCPQIGWTRKSDSVQRIAEALGIGLDAILFVDDQPFERDEVCFALPAVTTFDAADLAALLQLPALRPAHVTSEARMRRQMYQADLRRQQSEAAFPGTRSAFLATLGMRLTVRRAGETDLRRAEELTMRTNQLNTTGRTFAAGALGELARSPDYRVLVADLEDRYGSSGTVGLALIELGADGWLVKLFITSCRVINRGIGTMLLAHILRSARDCGARLRAEFVPTDRNRIMYLTYKFSGFVDAGERDGTLLLEHPLQDIRPIPPYVTVYADASMHTISDV
jgi:FkbH-like protein